MIAVTTNSKDKATSDLLAQLEALKAENERLKKQTTNKLSLKVSEKGCLSIYGLGRFPLSAYASQWRRVIQMIPEIERFMAENKDKLTEKA